MNLSIFTAVLLGAVCVLVKVQAHIDIYVNFCQTNDTAPEAEKQLDGDEMYYADFKNKEIMYTGPEFAGKYIAPTGLAFAQHNHLTCLDSLKTLTEVENNPPEEIEAPESQNHVSERAVLVWDQDPPQSTIYSMEEVELGKNNSLICFVNNFFPPHIYVKWTKNNVEVKDGVTLSRYYPNPDMTFQQFSTLSITPEEGDVYSCSVEHKGLPEPLTRIWEPEANIKSDKAATAFCGIGLTLGLLGVGVGTFFHIKGNNCN